MLIGRVRGRDFTIKNPDVVTSGSVGMGIEFIFSDEWDSLHKIGVFDGSGNRIAVEIVDNECEVPWEVLTIAGSKLTIGVYGTNTAGTIVIPTIWSTPIIIYQGTDPIATEGLSPTPNIYAKFVNMSAQAVETANSALDIAQGAADDVEDAMNYLYEHGMPSGDVPLVRTFNGRSGAVVPLGTDINELPDLAIPTTKVIHDPEGTRTSQAEINEQVLEELPGVVAQLSNLACSTFTISSSSNLRLNLPLSSRHVIFTCGPGADTKHMFIVAVNGSGDVSVAVSPAIASGSTFTYTTGTSRITFANSSSANAYAMCLAFNKNNVPTS